jgi:DNA topoisomerase-1
MPPQNPSETVLQISPGTVDISPAEQRAEEARLTYVSDTEPGIRRKGGPRRFSYHRPGGAVVRDEKTLARIRALAIPPAWKEVWISPDAGGHIQATGRDDRGRKQYRYHERWAACRDEVKYGSLIQFAQKLPRLRARVDADLRKRSLSRDRVVAAIVWLLDNTLIRVGNPAYARDNKSFGLTTLRTRHVEINGAALRFAFKGKSGKEWRLRLVDRRMARIVRSIQELPGQSLFQYFDGEDTRRQVRSDDVNAYMREAMEDDFSSKHFRTWGATVHAATLLATTAVPPSQAGARRVLNKAIDQVAARLGNTRTVCRAGYIHPNVIEAWNEGRLAEEMLAARKSFRKIPEGMDEAEMTVLRWLEAGSNGSLNR